MGRLTSQPPSSIISDVRDGTVTDSLLVAQQLTRISVVQTYRLKFSHDISFYSLPVFSILYYGGNVDKIEVKLKCFYSSKTWTNRELSVQVVVVSIFKYFTASMQLYLQLFWGYGALIIKLFHLLCGVVNQFQRINVCKIR